MGLIGYLVGEFQSLSRRKIGISKRQYERLVEKHVIAWLDVTNPRKIKGDKYKMEFEIVPEGDSAFRATAYLYSPEAEGSHEPGKGVKEGFFRPIEFRLLLHRHREMKF